MRSIIEKPEISPKEFADNLFGPEDERKAQCIYCGTVWYEIHYKDGVCHACQEKKLPGRSVVARRDLWKSRLLFIIIIILSVAIALIMS